MAKTDKIGIDLKGRVNRLRLAERNMLLPVLEAVVNSIHAIEDAKIENGKRQIAEIDENLILDIGVIDICLPSKVNEYDKSNFQYHAVRR